MGWGAGGGDQLGAATPVVSVNFFFFFNVLFIAGLNLHDLNFYFFNYLFIYLFMAVLGLCFCARAFSSCGKRGPLFIAVRGPLITVASHYRGLSCCGAQAPDAQAQ